MLSWRADHADGVGFAFTDRYGGVSSGPYAQLNLGGHVGDDPAAVAENRCRVAAAIGVPAGQVVYMRQVHGCRVAVVDGPWKQEPPEVDALVTTRRGLALAVLVADCAPVLLADSTRGVVGVAHAGRAGLAAGVVPAVLGAMRDLGADPRRLVAHLGPAVCGACYEVPQDLQDSVAAAVPAARAATRSGTPSVDVPAGVVSQLSAAGLGEVHRVPGCTAESGDSYSYRRDRVTGRFAGLAWLEP